MARILYIKNSTKYWYPRNKQNPVDTIILNKNGKRSDIFFLQIKVYAIFASREGIYVEYQPYKSDINLPRVTGSKHQLSKSTRVKVNLSFQNFGRLFSLWLIAVNQYKWAKSDNMYLEITLEKLDLMGCLAKLI